MGISSFLLFTYKQLVAVKKDAKKLVSRRFLTRGYEGSGNFAIVEEVRSAGFDGVLFGVFELLCASPQFLFLLLSAMLTYEGRCTAFAPIIFEGHDQQSATADQRQHTDNDQYPCEIRQSTSKATLALREVEMVRSATPPA